MELESVYIERGGLCVLLERWVTKTCRRLPISFFRPIFLNFNYVGFDLMWVSLGENGVG